MVTDAGASKRSRRATDVLLQAGRRLGYEVTTEYPVQGGRLDVVWLLKLPDAFGAEPTLVAAFEVESSWRTRKHLKGDYLNLFDAGAAVGVLVLLGEGRDVEATRQFAEVMVQRAGPRVQVWSEADLEELARGLLTSRDEFTRHGFRVAELQDKESTPATARDFEQPPVESMRHAGKYRALWQWLTGHTEDEVNVTFAEVEEIIGMPLPRSSRRYAAHWHGYEGSAVARAIQDAGWQATDVSLKDERLTFRRRTAS